VVVIDVLRVCSTIVTALDAGAEKIYPTLTVDEAFLKARQLESAGEEVLLCGEREGIRVEGFHMGNSPREYSRKTVEGRTLVISSTNGTGAMKRSSNARRVLVGSFLNGQAVAEVLADQNQNTVFYLSGREMDFSYEDAAGAGLIIHGITKILPACQMSDSALMCRDLYLGCRHDIAGMFRRTFHGRYLESLGFGDDLDFCARTGVSPRVPEINPDGFIHP